MALMLASVVGAFITQLIEIRALRRREDITFERWRLHFVTQIVQSLSLTTGCIP